MHAALVSAVVLAATTKKSSGSSAFPLLILVGLFFVAYFVLIRPARSRQRAAMDRDLENRRQIAVGEEVITTSGLIATIVAKTDDEVTLEIAPGVHARYVPAAIMRLRDEDLPPDPDGAVDHDGNPSAEPDVTNHEVIDPGSTDPSVDPPDEPAST